MVTFVDYHRITCAYAKLCNLKLFLDEYID